MKNLLGEEIIDQFRGEHWFLSNFYPSPFKIALTLEGGLHTFHCPTAEHAYQAAKATTLYDATKISSAETPALAKKLGGNIKMRDDWENVKESVMLSVLALKFSTNEKLMRKLVDTGNAELIEKNTWGDTFWGVCDGEGKNMLGILLMKVREAVKPLTTPMNL